MNLNHRVIAVVGADVKRVHCLTCGSDHKYYPPKGQPSDPVQKEAPKARKSAGGPDRATQAMRQKEKSERSARGEWTAFMQEMPEGISLRSYSASESYEPGEFIEHPVFGAGKVLAVSGRERIEVIFCDGRKTLIFNKKK
jgi:hypothetical protein